MQREKSNQNSIYHLKIWPQTCLFVTEMNQKALPNVRKHFCPIFSLSRRKRENKKKGQKIRWYFVTHRDRTKVTKMRNNYWCTIKLFIFSILDFLLCSPFIYRSSHFALEKGVTLTLYLFAVFKIFSWLLFYIACAWKGSAATSNVIYAASHRFL